MSGIVRKVDDLGRIVIPKEIRKNLDIKNNDEIEIICNENHLVLKKYYKLKEKIEVIKDTFNMFDKLMTFDYILADKDKVIYSSIKDTNVINQKISKQVLDFIIDARKLSIKDNIKITDYYDLNAFFYIVPIIIDTDSKGIIIGAKSTDFLEGEKVLINAIEIILKNQIE